VRDVHKQYGATRALDGIHFELRAGEVHALCGHNGAGKSTLVKMLAGLTSPDAGELLVDGVAVEIGSAAVADKLGIAVVEQELALAETLSVSDNVFLGHPNTPWLFRRQRSRARQFLDQVGLDDVDEDARVGQLSLGQRQLVEIARMLARNARILILDEPTATLSQTEIARVFRVVRRLVDNGCAAIFVTHRLGEVFDLCERVTVVKDGKNVATRHTADLTKADLVKLMVDGDSTGSTAEEVPVLDGAQILKVRTLAVPGHCANFSLEARAGEIVALAGQLGAGATQVLRALAGLDESATGDVEVAGHPLKLGNRRRSQRRGIAYVSEDRAADGLFFGRAATENLTANGLRRLGNLGWARDSTVRGTARGLADGCHFDQRKLRDAPETLSGGNQQKLLMGRSAGVDGDRSRILLLSEPTRGVDINSRGEIYQVLRRAASEGSTVIFASTDLEEIFELSDTIWTLFGGEVQGVYDRRKVTTSQVLADMTHGTLAEVSNG
jgi:ABC-type sugar transport system ATPase subunit